MKVKRYIVYIVFLFCLSFLVDGRILESNITMEVEQNIDNKNIHRTNIYFNNFKILDDKYESKNFTDILRNEYTVLFVFSEKDCKACISYYLNIMSQYFDDNDVVVLSEDCDFRAIRFFKTTFDVSFNFYRKKDTNKSIRFDSIYSPFVSIVTRDNILSYVYHPDISKKNEFNRVVLKFKHILHK